VRDFNVDAEPGVCVVLALALASASADSGRLDAAGNMELELLATA
jgi:hypothetical protein